MPSLPQILLGILIGYFGSQAQVECVWWPHLFSAPDSLKSKVPLTQRGNAAAFYRSVSEAPPNFDYFLLASTALLLLSFIGGIVQHPKKRVLYTISTVLLSVAGVVEVVFARPIIKLIIAKKKNLIENLFNVAFYHTIVLGSLLLIMALQTSYDEDGAEEEEEPKKKKKEKDE
ncbi:hypothetical protein HDV01_000708 [Terramyces sp. JEL0728]|nr:hypothetical protein HDV01_000708 [Terramyces sp. JEL0728]